jgi:hypothetical protein
MPWGIEPQGVIFGCGCIIRKFVDNRFECLDTAAALTDPEIGSETVGSISLCFHDTGPVSQG